MLNSVKSTLLVLSVLLCLPGLSAAVLLQGKTTIDGDAVGGVTVSAYPVSVLDFNSPAPHLFGPTAADGAFTIDLPKGRYYLISRGEGLFSFYGRNPVSVSGEGLQGINLLMKADNLPVPEVDPQVETGVVGVVTDQGRATPGAVVTIYTDISSQLRGMGLGFSQPTDETGLFSIPLPPGNYYLVVRVRKSGLMAGPLKSGDLFGYLPQNPLVVEEGSVARVHIPLIEVPEKVDRYASSLFGNTTISGRILDTAGNPVVGVQAVLYADPMMLNRPLYVSQRTGADGTFILSFPKGGVYYLAARNHLGGTPAPGDLYGRYAGSDDHSLRIRSGKSLQGIEIVVQEIY